MSNAIDLKNLEKRAFQTTYQDGLLDIYMGGIVMSMASMVFIGDSDAFPVLRFSIFMFGMLAFNFIYVLGKKYITTPRLGQVKFGPQRQRRARTLVMVLSGIALLQVFLVAGTVFLLKNPQWAASLGFGQADPNYERLTVAIIGTMFVGPSVALIAYFRDFMRGYYIAFILSLGVFSLVWFNQPVYMMAAGLLIVIPGVVLFIRFLREYPHPPAEVAHE